MRNRLSWIVSIVLSLVVIVPHAAQAKDLDLAKQQYKLGATLYARGAYRQALAQFKASYANSKRAALLYNVGRCHENLGNLREAVSAYETYLRQTHTTNKVLKIRIENLKRRIAAKNATHQDPKPDVSAPELSAPTSPSPKPTPHPSKAPVATSKTAPENKTGKTGDGTRGPETKGLTDNAHEGSPKSNVLPIIAWSSLGAGVAALVTGSILGAMAQSKASEVEDAAKAHADWADTRDTQASGESLAAGQTAMLIAGGILTAAGAGLLIYHYTAGSERPTPGDPDNAQRQTQAQLTLAPEISPRGFSLSASFSF